MRQRYTFLILGSFAGYPLIFFKRQLASLQCEVLFAFLRCKAAFASSLLEKDATSPPRRTGLLMI